MRFLTVVLPVFGMLGLSALGQTPRVSRAAALAPGSFIGVGIQEVDSERAKTLKLGQEGGVEVTRVDPDSPADKAGVKTGDVVLQFSGQRVEGIEQFSRLVRETPPGREVKLDMVRSGAPQTATVKVGMRRVPQAFGGFVT